MNQSSQTSQIYLLMRYIVGQHNRLHTPHRGVPPPLTQPEEWYQYTDKESVGFITTCQVLSSLKASLRPNTWIEDRTINRMLEKSTWPIMRCVTHNQFLRNDMHVILIKIERDYRDLFDRESGHVNPYRNEITPFEGPSPRS